MTLNNQQLGDLFKSVFKTKDGDKLLQWMIAHYEVFKPTPINRPQAQMVKNIILEFIGYITSGTSQQNQIYSYLDDN